VHNRGLRAIRALRNSQVASFAFACGWLVLLAVILGLLLSRFERPAGPDASSLSISTASLHSSGSRDVVSGTAEVVPAWFLEHASS
jgi:hypothetical protein